MSLQLHVGLQGLQKTNQIKYYSCEKSNNVINVVQRRVNTLALATSAKIEIGTSLITTSIHYF